MRKFETRLDGTISSSDVPEDLTVDADRELLGAGAAAIARQRGEVLAARSTIEIRRDGNGAVDIIVRNTGRPFRSASRRGSFERFYRGAQARHIPGTGMGLAIVQQIARAHGGTLSVSSSPEAGTTFTLSLPARRPAHERRPDSGRGR